MPTRDPYCDKAYWDFSQRALREIDVEIDPYAGRTSQEVVDKLRSEGRLFFLEVPGAPDKVMAVPGKVFRGSTRGEISSQVLSGHLQTIGFNRHEHIPGDDHGGKANWRERVEGEALDVLPLGGNLRQTQASESTRHWDDYNDLDEDGRPKKKARKVSFEGGTYKIDLPNPTTNGAEAGSSGAATPSGIVVEI